MNFPKIDPKDRNSSIRDLNKQIKHGLRLQELTNKDIEELSEDERFDYVDAIIVQPDYQREYRYTIADESLLVESIIVGIPVPPIFLANTRFLGIQVLNVVDGQHRLTAFYRYINNEFKLQGLKLCADLNDKYFKDLESEIKEKIISANIQQIIFKEFPGKVFELEIFNRYNKGTKPLTPQEIRNAVYGSKFNSYVNSFSKMICTQVSDFDIYTRDELKKLGVIYNATQDRFLKKKIQESIFVIFNILEFGFSDQLKKSPQYADSYMKQKAEFEDELNKLELEYETKSVNSDVTQIEVKREEKKIAIDKNFNIMKEYFRQFNDLVLKINEKVEYPFSREIYGISSRNYKFQISIAMILAGLVNKLLTTGESVENLKNIDALTKYLSDLLGNSYLEDSEYNASSTNYVELTRLIENWIFLR
ncbi:DUF262 domain-containing protein [Acinetobacter shaoyimingii]|uniref:DUF262 domain-containing protein n=1 Tax=Acinetobacter shaoyimingii TaxID=2715164 RepID=A0A6G8RTJ7_9GAMM|nr:DUF262 domain-containing protein [Acinetobacter shaoyimingii]QIO05289.1 DUF262 domain-containing protein [Acinetobacter shaoyimingii]